MSGPRAAIDIGSNTLLLTVLDADGRTLVDEERIVGLGHGLGDGGPFRPERMAAAEAALAGFVATAERCGVAPGAIRAVATSGARRATNTAAFLARVHAATGLRVRVLSGDEEARTTWVGGLVDLPAIHGDLLVIDIGGGSTELAQGTRAGLRTSTSLELGTVRLTERFLAADGRIPDRFDPAAHDALVRHVRSELARVTFAPTSPIVVGVAGTATTLAAMALGLDAWDAGRIHGTSLSRTVLEHLRSGLLAADRAERSHQARVAPARADWLLAGATLLLEVLRRAEATEVVASDRGLRYGLLL